MKKNLVPLLGIAFVVAIIATGLFYVLFAARLGSAATSAGHTSIVVASHRLDKGADLKATDVKLSPWGPDTPEGAMTTLDQVNGLTLVASLVENEPVLASRVASRTSGVGAGLGIAPGMRAISVHASDSTGVVTLLRPGYKVDVQMVSTEAEVRTILQNVEVLAMNTAGDGHTNVPVVTLLVSPEGADLAGLGDSTARVRITLRNPLDDHKTDLRRVTASSVMK
jgi:Flp pilus assembly protein CpaB